MDNKENTQIFSLEDIMREFGAEVPEEEAEVSTSEPEDAVPVSEELPEAEEASPEPAPELPETEAEADAEVEAPSEEEPSGEAAVLTRDTIRLDDLTEAVNRARAEGKSGEDAVEATDEESEPTEETGEEETVDADGEEAEEVEESNASEAAPDEHSGIPLNAVTAPPPPIEFRSRLRELKKKLVAGPEKRYYDLTEVGLGRVQTAIFVSILIVLLCAGATGLYAMGAVMANRLRLMIFSQVLAMLVSATLGCYVLMDGIGDLFKGRFTLNTMLVLTLVACCADAFFCLRELRVPCCAAFCLEMTMALWNRYLRRKVEMGQMDTLRKAVRLDGVVKMDNYFDGRPGILRSEGQLEHFTDNYQTPTGPEKVQNIFALVSLLLCVGIAVFAGVRHGLSMAFQIFATSLLVAVPASFFICQSRPAAILQRRLHMVGTVICGWQGVKGLCGKASFPLTDRDLFPLGSTKLNGVKFFGDLEPDLVISYAASVIRASGSSLDPVFSQLLKSRGGEIYPATDLRSYPAGIGGDVLGERVLLGTQNFLQNMGVEIPEGTMVNQAVYCAVDGNLCAVFAINYNRAKAAAGGLVTLCGYRKLNPVVLSTDFMIDESFLRSKFGINTKRFSFPTRDVRDELAAVRPDPQTLAFALTTQENLSASAYAVTGARALRTACKLGLTVHMIAGIVGMLIMLALGYIGATELLTPFNVLLYQLVWTLPGLLVTEWTRAV